MGGAIKVSRRQVLAWPFVALVPVLSGRADTLCWSGWREPYDQVVIFGFWYQVRQNGKLLVATTLGRVDEYTEGDAIDLTCAPRWPYLRLDASRLLRESVKARTRTLLETWVNSHAST